MNSKTGQESRIYTYNGKVCPTNLLNKGRYPKQLIAYQLIISDLMDAQSWLNQAYDLKPGKPISDGKLKEKDRYIGDFIVDKKTHSLIKSLFFSSLIFYGKCFTEAEGRGTKLEREILPIDYRDKHDQIMNYRNTIAAHSGIGEWDTGKCRLVLPPRKKSKTISPRIYAETRRLDFSDDREEAMPFHKLIEFLIAHAQAKKTKLSGLIFEKIVSTQTEEYWYRTTPKPSRKSK